MDGNVMETFLCSHPAATLAVRATPAAAGPKPVCSGQLQRSQQVSCLTLHTSLTQSDQVFLRAHHQALLCKDSAVQAFCLGVLHPELNLQLSTATAHTATCTVFLNRWECTKQEYSWLDQRNNHHETLVRYAGTQKAVRMLVIFLAKSERLFLCWACDWASFSLAAWLQAAAMLYDTAAKEGEILEL